MTALPGHVSTLGTFGNTALAMAQDDMTIGWPTDLFTIDLNTRVREG